jgi:hypothetical protein
MSSPLLRINAWDDEPAASGPLALDWKNWATDQHVHRALPHLDYEAAPPDPRKWLDVRVGWGVLLPENKNLEAADGATACDAIPEVTRLLEARNGVVLRHVPSLMPGYIRRYYSDGHFQDLPLNADWGTGEGELPAYLLILASPEVIPWKDQYVLSGSHFVGRLCLEDEALANYIEHAISGWSASQVNLDRPVIWAVDWGDEDITSQIRTTISDPVCESFRGSGGLKPQYMSDGDALGSKLIDALGRGHPALVITTSHGRTSPLDRVEELRAGLGLPVDLNRTALDAHALVDGWDPRGCIWYAHACCSAGSDGTTSYAGLFESGGRIDTILNSIATAGSTVALLPTALLSAPHPVRAFVGHVEPTFDWPLQDPQTGYPLAGEFIRALTENLYNKDRQPVGLAFRGVHAEAGTSFQKWHAAADKAGATSDPLERAFQRDLALRSQLTALDREGVVILGDPAVAIPERRKRARPAQRHCRLSRTALE